MADSSRRSSRPTAARSSRPTAPAPSPSNYPPLQSTETADDPYELSEVEPVAVAVIGAGGWGRNHVRNFASLPGARLRMVCDQAEPARSRVAMEHPHVTVTSDSKQVLDDPRIRAVVVATDAPTHFELASRALRAGKEVFVEKPLTLDSPSSLELCRIAEGEGRVLMVGHLLLYHPAVEMLHELVEAGELGDVLYAYSQRLNLGVVRRDENAWWSLAPHDVSVANYLLGEEAVAVSANGAAFLQVEQGIEDVVFATLHYADGKLAHVHVSWLDPHKTRRLTVVGSRKMAVFDDTSADQKLALFDKGAEAPRDIVSYEEGVRIRTGDIRIPALKMQEPLRRECLAFLDAARTGQRPRADGRSGLAVVRVLEAAAASLAQGGRRIELASDEGAAP